MGLDIYLYRYDNFERNRELEENYESYSEKLWAEAGEYENLTQEQKDEIRSKLKEYALPLGLDEWGSCDDGVDMIEETHPDYPDHYFKIGYFRSSYNEGGIERILRNLGLSTLHDIFNYESGDEYYFQPNWEESLVRCEETIELFRQKGGYRVHHVSGNIFKQPDVHSEKDALDIFLEELEKERPTRNDGERYNYSNSRGEFNMAEPIKVLAFIPGTYKIFNSQPCVYVVTESDNTWYINALEIVRDTIKYVLSKENKEQYYLHWSG
jgi:hypothetical protein